MGCGCGSVVKLLADYLERQLPPALRAGARAASRSGVPAASRSFAPTNPPSRLLRSLRDDELPPELRLTVKSFIDAKCHNN